VTKQHNDDCKRLLRLMGVPVVEVLMLCAESRGSKSLLLTRLFVYDMKWLKVWKEDWCCFLHTGHFRGWSAMCCTLQVRKGLNSFVCSLFRV